MAAPSGITWGDIVGGYGRIGLHISKSSTSAKTTVTVQVWFWSKYSVSDTSNTLYFNFGKTSATTSKGSKSISTTVDSGSGWSTSNQKKLGEYSKEYSRTTAEQTINCAAKLSSVDRVGGTMTHKRSFTIPKLPSYTVKYDANGGSGEPDSQTKWYGTSLTLRTGKPTRTGYTFSHWNTKADGSGTTNFNPGGTYTGNAAVTFYAIWKENALTVNFYSNQATAAFSGALNAVGAGKNVLVRTAKYYYDNAYNDGLYNYSAAGSTTYLGRTGYTATGKWGTSTSGGTLVDEDTSFASGQKLAEAFGKSLKTGNASVNVYAQWTIKTYTVSYNANGGTGAPTAQTKTYGTNLTLSTTTPTKAGHNFLGWGTSASDTTVDYAPGGTYSTNAAITLYAIWSPHKHTVSFNANGGSGAPSNQTKTYGSTITLSSTVPARIGYTFKGWGTSASDTTVDYAAGQVYGADQNGGTVTLYAIWQINSYKLTVNPNGGSWNGSTANQEFTQNYNTTKDIPVPTWTGHTFSGWTLSGNGTLGSTGAVATTYKYGAGNGTLAAKWDTNDYTVSFNAGANGGNIASSGAETASKEVSYGSAIGELPVAVRKNYKFVGWFTAQTGGTKITSSYVVTQNVTFYAQYEIDASAYANDNGIWKAGVVFARDEEDSTMAKGHAKVNDNGIWKDGYCN